MPSTTYRPLTGRFSNMTHWDGANCLTVGKRHLSQREAAMEAVQAIGLNQICDVESSVFVGYEQYGEMISSRLEEMTSEFVRDCGK